MVDDEEKCCLAFFCADDDESLIIDVAIILISRQHLTCFMAINNPKQNIAYYARSLVCHRPLWSWRSPRIQYKISINSRDFLSQTIVRHYGFSHIQHPIWNDYRLNIYVYVLCVRSFRSALFSECEWFMWMYCDSIKIIQLICIFRCQKYLENSGYPLDTKLVAFLSFDIDRSWPLAGGS